MAAVDRDETPGERRWFVRVRGEQKDTFTIWFHLQQRTLHYETYVMPAPEENHAAFFEHLLRRNRKLYGAAFAIGEEDASSSSGQVDNAAVTDDELDRVLGSLYAWVEQFFRPALRIGFASRFSADRGRRSIASRSLPIYGPGTRSGAPPLVAAWGRGDHGQAPAAAADLLDHGHRDPRQHPRRAGDPRHPRAFDQPDSRAGVFVAAGTLPGIVMAPVIGVLADRFGRRAVLVPCLVAFGVFGLLSALAPTFPALLAAAAVPGDRLGRASSTSRSC